MEFEFDDDKPIYKQLVEKLKLEIVLGHFQSGEKLPSVRELSTMICVNPNTIQRSLAELENEHLIYTKRTAGKFVTEDETIIHQLKQELAKDKIDSFVSDIETLGLKIEDVIKLLKERKNS